MKKLLCLLLLCMMLLSSCGVIRFNIPEGYSAGKHNREEAQAYAGERFDGVQLSGGHADLQNEYGHDYREWEIMVGDIECHVGSVMRRVWNEGIMAGEFARECYVMDSDYDYYLLESLLSKLQPNWKLNADTAFNRYNWNDLLLVELPGATSERISDAEFEALWASMLEVHEVFIQYPVQKKLLIALPLQDGSSVSTSDFTPAEKQVFFEACKKGLE